MHSMRYEVLANYYLIFKWLFVNLNAPSIILQRNIALEIITCKYKSWTNTTEVV